MLASLIGVNVHALLQLELRNLILIDVFVKFSRFLLRNILLPANTAANKLVYLLTVRPKNSRAGAAVFDGTSDLVCRCFSAG